LSNEKLIDILNERLAKGEITPSEYDELKARLIDPSPADGGVTVASPSDSNEHLVIEHGPLADSGDDVYLPDGNFIIFIARNRLRFFLGVQILMSLYIGLVAFPTNVVQIIEDFLLETDLYNQVVIQISPQLAPVILGTMAISTSAIIAGVAIKVISQLLISRLTFFSFPVGSEQMKNLKELEKGSISSRMQDISKSYSGFVVVRVGGNGRFVYSVKVIPLIVMNGILILIATNFLL
jgi:hypothetical protein